jgi:hypothetical protein
MFWDWGHSSGSIFQTSYRENMILHFPYQLPEKFSPLFDTCSIFNTTFACTSCRWFDSGKIPGKHHGFHFHYQEGGKIWKLYSDTNTGFLSLCKEVLIFLDKLYQSRAYKEWKRVWAKIPRTLGLFGTIFTTLAGNMNLCSWYIDPCNLEFSVLIYAKN